MNRESLNSKLAEAYDHALKLCELQKQDEWMTYAKEEIARYRDGAALEQYPKFKQYASYIEDNAVLDVGCKYGHLSPIFVSHGARKIICMDVIPEYIDIGKKLFSNESNSISFLLADGPFLPIEPETVGFVYMNEVISHINPMYLDTMLAEIGRILRPDAAILISDGNNLLNEYSRKTLLNLYRCWEQAEPGTQTDRDVVTESFASRRKKQIALYAPELPSSELELLAKNTSGLWGEHLKSAIDNYTKTKALIHRPYRSATCPTAPEAGGAVMERGFYPEQIIMSLWNQGLSAWEIRSSPTSKGWRGFIKRFCYHILPILERIVWIIRQRLSSPVMQVIAVKPGQIGEEIPPGTSSVKGGWNNWLAPL